MSRAPVLGVFKEASYEALTYVYDKYLSNPFSDAAAPRGPYIDRNGVYRQYPNNQQIRKDPAEVYRPNHGLAHNIRVTVKIRDVVGLYADPQNNINATSRKWFEALNTEEEKIKLEIASSFYIVILPRFSGHSAKRLF